MTENRMCKCIVQFSEIIMIVTKSEKLYVLVKESKFIFLYFFHEKSQVFSEVLVLKNGLEKFSKQFKRSPH